MTSDLSGYEARDYDTAHSLLAEVDSQDNNNMQRSALTSLHQQVAFSSPASKPELGLTSGGLSLQLTSAWANQYMGEATEAKQRPGVTEDGAGNLKLYF